MKMLTKANKYRVWELFDSIQYQARNCVMTVERNSHIIKGKQNIKAAHLITLRHTNKKNQNCVAFDCKSMEIKSI